MLLALNLNSWWHQTYFFIRYQQSKRNGRNHKYLQLVTFEHPNICPNNQGQTHNWVGITPHNNTLVLHYQHDQHSLLGVILLNQFLFWITTTYSKLECNQLLNQLKQLCNLERRLSHQFSFQRVKLVGVVVVHVVVRQTQPLNQNARQYVLIMGTIEGLIVQHSRLVLSVHPTIGITLSCAYCHDFKNCPFVDDKWKQLMRLKFIISL
jgi:hypothetical protein